MCATGCIITSADNNVCWISNCKRRMHRAWEWGYWTCTWCTVYATMSGIINSRYETPSHSAIGLFSCWLNNYGIFPSSDMTWYLISNPGQVTTTCCRLSWQQLMIHLQTLLMHCDALRHFIVCHPTSCWNCLIIILACQPTLTLLCDLSCTCTGNVTSFSFMATTFGSLQILMISVMC